MIDTVNSKVEHLERVEVAFQGLHNHLVGHDFSGWEYDDLLASPYVTSLTRFGLYPKIAAVQLAKRSPLNLRRMLGVPKLPSTKGWGFIIKGYLHYYLATGDKKHLDYVHRGLDWLIENRSPGYSGYCWGNDFDFASRLGFYRKGLPTIVWTSHIQETFDLAWRVLGDTRFREVVTSVADFIADDLERTVDDSGFCFAYAPRMNGVVHNANLLGAVALLRAWHYTGNDKHFQLAKQALAWSVSKMNPDGSWYYGDLEMQKWIDNYHTAYNLDCLVRSQELAGEDFVDQEVIKKTYVFWAENFFESNGKPKFYHDRLHPIDIQATAQAIESFSKYSVYDDEALGHAFKVCLWALENMLKENGSFRYRIYRSWKNNLEALHWGQATMLSSLGHLLYFAKGPERTLAGMHSWSEAVNQS